MDGMIFGVKDSFLGYWGLLFVAIPPPQKSPKSGAQVGFRSRPTCPFLPAAKKKQAAGKRKNKSACMPVRMKGPPLPTSRFSRSSHRFRGTSLASCSKAGRPPRRKGLRRFGGQRRFEARGSHDVGWYGGINQKPLGFLGAKWISSIHCSAQKANWVPTLNKNSGCILASIPSEAETVKTSQKRFPGSVSASVHEDGT